MKGNNSVNISCIIEKHYIVHNLQNYPVISILKAYMGKLVYDAFSSLRVPVFYLTSLGSKVILNTNAIRDHLK